MGLQPPILEDVSSQSIRRLLVWKLVNPNVNYAVGTSAGEFAAMTDSQSDRAPCRLWGCCGLEMPSHFSTCPPDLQDPPQQTPAPMSSVRR